MNEIIPSTPEVPRYIDTAAQEAAELAELVEDAKRHGAMPASSSHAKAEQHGRELIQEEVKEQEAEVKASQDEE